MNRTHDSDCAQHNEPAFDNEDCNCSVNKFDFELMFDHDECGGQPSAYHILTPEREDTGIRVLWTSDGVGKNMAEKLVERWNAARVTEVRE